MSKEHPIIALTGSAGAGTTTIRVVFQKLFDRMNIKPTIVQGDSFRAYDFETWDKVFADYQAKGINVSHFGPQANQFEKLEELFHSYSISGKGKMRQYICTHDDSGLRLGRKGSFTDYEDIPEGSDVLLYDGFHGGLVTVGMDKAVVGNDQIDVARHVDLLIGVTPNMNLEWIQKIQRDVKATGIAQEAVCDAILRRMPDYINYIIPQFSLTDINFQRVPLVDTSDPFIARDIPALDESMIIARFRNPSKFDMVYLLDRIDGSFMSRPNTLVIPGSEFEVALTIIFEPILEEMFQDKELY